MIRQAFAMKLKPGQAKEYQKRHDEIWPELTQLLTDSGILSYTIFLHESSLTLFAYQELAENHITLELPDQEIMQKWWAHMSDIMETNPDNSPKIEPLPELFHM